MKVVCSLSAKMIPSRVPGAGRMARMSIERLVGEPMSITVDGHTFEGTVIKATLDGQVIRTVVELPDDFGGRDD